MLWHYRHLAVNLIRREVRNRFVGSASGMLWALLHPLLNLAVYTFVFQLVFRPPELAGAHYLLFVAVGLWPWLAFQESIQRGAVAIQGYAGLIKKVAFPHELLVLAVVAATFMLHLIGYVLVLFALAVLGQPVAPTGLPLALGCWLTLFIAALGLSLGLSATQVFLRDTEHVLAPLMQIMLYLAPILYPLSLVPKDLRHWVEANPLTYLLTRLHDALERGMPIPQPTDLAAIGLSVALLFAGRAYFLRLSPYFEDFV